MAQEPQPIPSKGRVNPTLIALIGSLAVLLIILVFFATRPNADQDKLSDEQVNLAQPEATGPGKLCSSKATFDAIKRELFRRAGQIRKSDQATFDRLASYAVARMENPVMESEEGASGAANCSGSLSIDLPPGVEIAGGRRTLTADVDYRVDPGGNVTLGNADAIVTALATLTRVEEMPEPMDGNLVAPEENVAASESAAVQPGPPSADPGRPSFDCSRARTRGEIAVCSDTGLSALDLNMTTQYRRALGKATPQQHEQLQATRNRFLAYRDRCPDRECIAEAYIGRMREIRDIVEGRWQPSR
jgi:hypothetical protein